MQRFNKKIKQLTARATRAFCGSSSDDGRERAIAVSKSKQRVLLAGMQARCRRGGQAADWGAGGRLCVCCLFQQAAASKQQQLDDDMWPLVACDTFFSTFFDNSKLLSPRTCTISFDKSPKNRFKISRLGGPPHRFCPHNTETETAAKPKKFKNIRLHSPRHHRAFFRIRHTIRGLLQRLPAVRCACAVHCRSVRSDLAWPCCGSNAAAGGVRAPLGCVAAAGYRLGPSH